MYINVHLLSDNYCISLNFITSELLNKGCKIMLGLHLVLVTLHVWFRNSMSNTNRIGDTKYSI
jgi:hypothetical protein